MGADILVVSFDVFQTAIAKPSLVAHYETLGKTLEYTYNCFHIPDESSYKHRKHAPKDSGKATTRRPRLGCLELSREAIMLRDLTGMLNKLTDQNKATILPKIVKIVESSGETYIPVIVSSIWRMAKSSPKYQPYYVELILQICGLNENAYRGSLHKEVKTIWLDYVNNRSWELPVEISVDQSATEDEFCEYVAWKKQAIAAVEMWSKLCIGGRNAPLLHADIKSLWKQMASDVDTHFINGRKKLAEIIIEQLQAMMHQLNFLSNTTASEKIDEWLKITEDLEIIGPLKFRLMDMKEYLQNNLLKNMKNGCDIINRSQIKKVRNKK